MTGGGGSEVYFEFTQLGAQMRVAAIDAATAIEVVIIAPLSATRLHMQTLALAKLRKKLAEQPQPEPPRRLF
ncbi:MAG: serine hydroxymethyltransferase [Hyphomicrobiales bacterium]|nr:MAG: serine hydroxymethyltransferase [Hyphomicrobiales bacterium]